MINVRTCMYACSTLAWLNTAEFPAKQRDGLAGGPTVHIWEICPREEGFRGDCTIFPENCIYFCDQS